MTDIPPEDVLEEAITGTAPAVVERANLPAVIDRLVPIRDLIRDTVGDIRLRPVNRMGLEARSELAALRRILAEMQTDIGLWVDSIDLSFRRAAITRNAKELKLSDGFVRVEPPKNEWIVTDVEGLREQLYGRSELSREEVDSIFTEKRTLSADNRRLNYFAANRGSDIAAIIDAHRVQRIGDPLRSSVTYTQGRRIK